MAPVWTIKGQAGKTVDETAHSLEELQASDAVVDFVSMAAGTMTWTVWLKSSNDVATVVPDLGQTITLFRDAERFFTGIVTGRDPGFSPGSYSYTITVQDVWWWLSQVFLSSEVADQAAEESERTSYVFPTGSPRAHIIALISRAIELGVPIAEGSIASCFNIPRSSLRNIPFSEAVSELMRWVADGTVYVDYSGVGNPKLSMQRRDAAAVVTINLATAIAPSLRIKPRLDLKVEEVKVFFAKRATVDGKRVTIWDAYTAGASTSGLPVRQPVMVSGPEKVYDILPQDFTDSVTVRSKTIDVAAIIARYDERIRATGASGFMVGTFHETTISGSFDLPAITTQITDQDGNPIPGTFTKYLSLGEPKDWWTKDGIEHIQARVAATISSRVQSPAPTPGGYSPAVPDWFAVLGGQTYNYTINIPGSGNARVDVFATTTSVSVPLVKAVWNVPTLLIRAEDYGFVNPPEDLPDNLLATQDWLPYEGAVSYVTEDIAAGHHVGKVLNVSGFVPEASTMKALIVRHRVKLSTGENTLTIGAPERFTYRDLVNRFRQNGADNIVWLVDSVSGDPGENPPPDPDLEIPEPTDGSIFTEDGIPISTEDDQEILSEDA